MFKRVIYLGYYLKNLDRKKFSKFSNYVVKNYSRSKVGLCTDILISSLKYNISILDYFYFQFFKLSKEEREKYAGTGYMYEYQLIMNPKGHRQILENKLLFLDKYSNYISHDYAQKRDVLTDSSVLERFFKNSSKRF